MKRDTPQASHGRWKEILPQLGVSLKVLDGKHHPCPACGGTDRFRFHDRNDDGDYYCHGCGAGKGIGLVAKVNKIDYAEAANRVDEIIGNLPAASPRKSNRKADPRVALNDLWSSSRPVELNDPVGRYLNSRGILTKHPDIRFAPCLYHRETGQQFYGMIAKVRDADGNPATLHRTYLTQDGRKAPVEAVRKLMPGGFPQGGAIRLGDPDKVMGVAEGIETALAASKLYEMPVWSTISEVFLQTWEPPAVAEKIVIFGDNDENFVGQAAAYALAKRLKHDYGDGLDVEVRLPRFVGDWNDVLLVEEAIAA